MKRIYQLMGLAILLVLFSSFSLAQGTFQVQVQSRLSLREGPGTNFARITTMDVGTIVNVSARDSTNTWIFGTTNTNLTGWMALRYTSITGDQVFALPVSGASAPAPSVPSNPAPVAVPGNAITAVATANVNLRSGPSTSNGRVGLVLRGTQFVVSGRDAANDWAFGSYNGVAGWAAVAFFNIDVNGYLALPVSDGSTPPPATAVPSQPTVPTAPPVVAGNGIVGVATSNVNLRSGPSTSNGRVGLVLFNTQFIITGRNSAGTWAFGNYNGITGWSSSAFFSFDRNAFFALPVTDGSGGGAVAPPPVAPPPVTGAPPPSTAPVTGFAYGGHILNFNGNIAGYLRSARMTWVKKQVRYTRGQNPADFA
ncbi:MAG: SH3 domain-containing protein, partial [Aggregatilineales bacterium]